jgi:hypothetical protein
MTTQSLLAASLTSSLHMITQTLADFTDAEMVARPVPSANHAAWQIGHLTCSEVELLGAQGAKMPELPPGFAQRFTKETAASNDPAVFGSKTELLNTFTAVRNASIAFAQGLSDADLERPTKHEMVRNFAPTTGALLGMANMHLGMHLGQIQVIRRKLGRPVMF